MKTELEAICNWQRGPSREISRLESVFKNRLLLGMFEEARSLAEDLLSFSIPIDENADPRYGAFTVGQSDELINALGLAVHHDHHDLIHRPQAQAQILPESTP